LRERRGEGERERRKKIEKEWGREMDREGEKRLLTRIVRVG